MKMRNEKSFLSSSLAEESLQVKHAEIRKPDNKLAKISTIVYIMV